MKLQILETSIIKFEMIGTFLTGCFAMIAGDQQLSTIGWALMGSCLGGFVFTAISKPTTLYDWIIRWLTNVCAGIVIGLFAAAYYTETWDTIPLPYFAMLCSFFCGPITVIAIPIGLPILKTILLTAFNKLAIWLKLINK